MKRFIPVNGLPNKTVRRDISRWLDRISFFHIFLMWISIIIIFGLIYYFFADTNSYLVYSSQKGPVKGMLDYIYFSFITATSTGYGDILPSGAFKIITIFEVIFGLLLLAFVTSRLVSIKQDIILNEIYELSFTEKVNRLRSSLLMFRQNLNRVISKIEEKSIRKREVSDIYVYIAAFENSLSEILSLVDISSESYFKKILDPVDTELLFNSILHSFERLNELVTTLNEAMLEWKRDITLDLIKRCVSLNNDLFVKLNSSKNLPEKILADLNIRKGSIIDMLNKGCEVDIEKI